MEEETDFTEIRQRYYGLLVHLFWKEPEPDFVLSLAEGIEERVKSAGRLNTAMGEGWRAIRKFLQEETPESVAEEFTVLFLGPHAPEVVPYESVYLTGSLFQAPLVNVRVFMERVGLEKKETDNPEPEDILAFELEIMNWLVGKQIATENEEEEQAWLDLQAEFLKTQILVWGPQCAKDIAGAKKAKFYRGAGLLLQGFLEVERDLFRDREPKTVESLEEARKRHGRHKTWKGPLFDPPIPKDSDGRTES